MVGAVRADVSLQRKSITHYLHAYVEFVCLFVVVLHPSRVFHSNQDVITADKMLQNIGQCLSNTAFEKKGIFKMAVATHVLTRDLSFSPIISKGIDGLKYRVLG